MRADANRPSPVSILVAAGEAARGDLAAALSAVEASTHHVDSADQAISAGLAQDFDLLLLDAELPGIGATAAADILRRAGCGGLIAVLDHGETAAAPDRFERDFDAALALQDAPAALIVLCARARARRLEMAQAGNWIAEECADLAAQFSAQLPATLASMRAAAAGRDVDQLRRLLHRTKGSAGNFGHVDLGCACARIEGMIVGGEIDAAVAQTVAMTGAYLERMGG